MTLTIAELAQALDARLWGDGSLTVHGAAEAGQAGEGQIALATSSTYAERLAPGGMAILAEGTDPEALGLKAAILVTRPRLAMAALTRSFDPGPEIAPGIHASAIVDPSAELPGDAAIGPFAVIGARVRIGPGARIAAHVSIGADTVIGEGALIHAGARIAHGVSIGARVIVHSGAVIGGDGFSFVTPEKSGVEEIRETLGERQQIREQHWTRIHSRAESSWATMSRSARMQPSIAAPSAPPASAAAPRSTAWCRSATMSWSARIACFAGWSALPARPGSAIAWCWAGNAGSRTISLSATM